MRSHNAQMVYIKYRRQFLRWYIERESSLGSRLSSLRRLRQVYLIHWKY